MKKTITTLALTAIAASAFAQGTINFSNSGTSLVRSGGTSTTDTNGVAVPAGSGSLLLGWAPSGTAYVPWTIAMNETLWLAANPGWTVLSTKGSIAPLAGRFNAGTVTANTSSPGALIEAVVLGWTGSSTSFDAAYAAGAYCGIGPEFTIATGNPNTTPAGTPAPITSSTGTPFTGITLINVPEPTSFALAGLGAAALMIFRRRK